MDFLLCFPHLPPPMKEPSIQIPTRWIFWDISLSSSWSAGFMHKVIFLVSTPHPSDSLASSEASRVSLDLVTIPPFCLLLQMLLGSRRAERSYSTFKVRSSGQEKIPLVQGKEQRLRFAEATVKRYPTSEVRETQVRW